MTIVINVNGADHTVEADPSTPLLYVLRGELALNGPKFGCGLGQCGACTVLADGAAVFSCLLPLAAAKGRRITTVEGLGTIGALGPSSAPSRPSRRRSAATASPA